MTTETVLFVDDDANLLAALKRRLRKQFDLEVALGAEEGLQSLETYGPFAVVVADMRMPGMDGIEFLTRVKERNADTVRIMLTGNADLQTAINAVNEGNIFRFLNKPCPPEIMTVTLQAALEQYRLVTTERELLSKTLMGSIKVLTEILGLVNPVAFGQANRIARSVKHIVERLQLPDGWKFEVAALLSQIGCVTLPPDIFDKVYANAPLSAEEREMFASHPSVGHKLVVNIPRLEPIAQMIAQQHHAFANYPPLENLTPEAGVIALGAQILKTTLDFDRLLVNGLLHQEVLSVLRGRRGEYNPQLVTALCSLKIDMAGKMVKMVKIRDLNTNMLADEDIHAENGLLLVPKGQEITYPVMERLRNFSQRIGVVEPIRVIVSHQEAA